MDTLVIIKATGKETGGQYGLIEEVDPPGYEPPLHVHHNEDEAFVILEGEVTFTIGEQCIRAVPGAYVFAPRGVPHIFKVEGNASARMLTFNYPAGFEQFFVELGRPAPGPVLPTAGEPNEAEMAKLLELAEKYGLQILG